jgi:uncharacterized membrane protein YvlD (DUF360 family)
MIQFIFKLFYLFLINGFLFYLIEFYLWPSIIIITPELIGHLVIGGVFALINVFIKPVVKFLALPFRWLTLGVFGMAINGILLYCVTWFLAQNDIAGVSLIINGGVIEYVLLGILLGIGNSLMSCRCK